MPVHPTAIVDPDARLGDEVTIGPYVVVEPDVEVGARCEIRAHATLKRFTTLGTDNVVHEGAVLGGEPQDVAFKGDDTRLVVGDRNRIREGVTIHRSTLAGGTTVVGSDCFFMAYAHVAHDNRIGDRVILANNVALAGHVQIADRAFLGGYAGVHQFCRVGRLAMLGGQAKAVQDCLPFVITDGNPARARGLNTVGLKRAGIPSAERRALKEAYRLLVRAGLPLEAALEALRRLGNPLVDELIVFVEASKRGFAHTAPDASHAD